MATLSARLDRLEQAIDPDEVRVEIYLPHNGRDPLPTEPQRGPVRIYWDVHGPEPLTLDDAPADGAP